LLDLRILDLLPGEIFSCRSEGETGIKSGSKNVAVSVVQAYNCQWRSSAYRRLGFTANGFLKILI
jgi:hypothetical protein